MTTGDEVGSCGALGRRHGSAGMLVLACLVGCGEGSTYDEAQARHVGAPIVNGSQVATNSLAVVAIYHQHTENPADGWSPKPCSGRLLTPRADKKAILTAAHCVNSDIAVPIPESGLRVTAAVAPGVVTLDFFDSDRVATPYRVARPPRDENYLGFDQILDMAIVWVSGAIPGLVDNPKRSLLFMGATKAFEGFTNVTHLGYGCGDSAGGGRGVLRSASGFSFHSFYGNDYGPTGNDPIGYYFVQPGNNGTSVCAGDSGGPAILDGMQIGIHGSSGEVTGRDVAVTRRSAEFIQSQLGRLYVKPKVGSGALARASSGSGVTVSVQAESNTSRYKWRYDWSSKTVRAATENVCLDLRGSVVQAGTQIWAYECNGTPAQRWRYKLDGHLESDWDGWCAARVAGSLALRQCLDVDDQRWVWDADAGVVGAL